MKSGLTLRTRLVLLVIAAVVPLFGLSIAGAVLTAAEAVSRTTQSLEFSASLVAANQQRVAESARQVLTTIAHMPELAEGQSPQCQPQLKSLRDQLSAYSNLGIIGPDGYLRCHALGDGLPRFFDDRPYFQEALARRTFVTGGYLQGRISKLPIMTFALPVQSQGRVTAVVFAAVQLSELSRVVAGTPLPAGSHLVVMDRKGIVLAANPETSALVGQPVRSPLLQAAIKADTAGVFEGLDASGARQIYAFLPSEKPGESTFFVALSADRDAVLAPARQRLILIFLLLVLVAFLGSWMAWKIGGRAIMQPAADILEASEQIENGRLDVRVPLRGTGSGTEFTRIAKGFNRMADALEQRECQLADELANSIRAQAELRETQRKLLDAQRLGRIGHWELDLQNDQLSWSNELCELFGVPPGTFDGQPQAFLQLLHPDDRDRYELQRAAAQADGTELDIEYRIITPQGAVRWMHQLGKVRVDAAGQAVARSGVVQEITVRKQSELALARSAEQLRRTSEMARIGGWEIDLGTRAVQWSEALYRIHEIHPGQTVTVLQALRFIAPEARLALRQAVRAAIRQASSWDLELPMRTTSGRRIWVHTQGRPVLEGRKVVGLTGAQQDITVQYESRAYLKLLEVAISRLNEMVLITDARDSGGASPRIVYVNDAFERHTGYRREEVLGKSPRLLQGPQTQRSEIDRMRAAMRNREPVRAELINYTKAGDAVWIEIDIVPMADSAGRITHWVAVERDITQRKLAERALGESEQRYAALFEMGPVPMWVYDSESLQFLTVNSAAVKRYGYSATEFLSMRILDIRTPAEAENLKMHLNNSTVGSRERWEHRRKDGSLFMVRAFSKPVQYAGKDARFVVVLDISPQIKAESDVQAHLFSLQRAADATQAITRHQTVDGMLQEVAEQARGVIGAHQAVITLPLGGDWTQAVRASSLSERSAACGGQTEPMDGHGPYAQVLENNRAVRMTRAQIQASIKGPSQTPDPGACAAGHPALRGWLAVPLTGRSGQNIGLLQLADKYEGEFTLQDEYVATELAQLAAIALENARLLEQVSQLNMGLERKVAERTLALGRQEALFRALAEQAPQVVWTATPDGMVTYLNRAWFDLAGGQLQDWMGDRWFAAIHPEDLTEVHAQWGLARANQSSYGGIRRLLARDGSYHTMSYRASPVLDDKGIVAFWVGIDADISEIKAIEAALRLSNQELEAFSYSVSHDLRSPLNTIDGFSRLLSKQLTGDMGKKAQHYLSRIQVGVAQMGKLIEDMLSLAQVSRMHLRYEPVDLSALGLAIFQEWQTRNPERQVAVLVEDGLLVRGDSRLLRVVMENLLGNAWKFTSQKVDSHIRIGKKMDAAGLPVFFVSDDGAGFDMAYADKLFTAFQRLHTAAEFPGTGIGLATVSRVIGRHGGRLWADAALGQGATFFFTVPHMPTATSSSNL